MASQINHRPKGGFTLIEMMMGASIMAVVSAALIGAFLGQASLNATARNLTAATNDATRVMEEIRRLNSGANCTPGAPTAKPDGYNSWDEWLAATSTGKSIQTTGETPFELVAVTCQDGSVTDCETGSEITCPDGASLACPAVGGTPVTCEADGSSFAPVRYCRFNAQVGWNEWRKAILGPTFDPIRVTVAVGWVQQGRSAAGSEFVYTPAHVTSGKFRATIQVPARFEVADQDGDGVIASQAMLSTLVTCR